MLYCHVTFATFETTALLTFAEKIGLILNANMLCDANTSRRGSRSTVAPYPSAGGSTSNFEGNTFLSYDVHVLENKSTIV